MPANFYYAVYFLNDLSAQVIFPADNNSSDRSKKYFTVPVNDNFQKWKNRRVAGIIATGLGAAGTGIGIGIVINNNELLIRKSDGKSVHPSKYKTGAIFAPISAVLCAGGVTLWAICEHKLKKLRNISTNINTTSFDVVMHF